MNTDDQSRSIGKVTSVAADRLVVELHRGTDNFTVVGFDDVHYVARLGSYIVIPVGPDYVVAEVVGLRERDSGSSGLRGEGPTAMDKAASAKYLDLEPVGTLSGNRSSPFRFGVSTFPSLYADALYALDAELDRIFDVSDPDELIPTTPPGDGNGSDTRLRVLTVGKSVVFAGYDIKVRIDDLFGGHSAVLGNTGSGKSCTVASVVQSLFERKQERPARGATFVFLDVNGEYRQAFEKLPSQISRRYLQFRSDPMEAAATPMGNETTAIFRLPHWFLNVEEWELLLRASERTQQPVLRMALGLATLFASSASAELAIIQNHIIARCVRYILDSEASSPTKKDRITAILSSFHSKDLNIAAVQGKISISYGEMADVQGVIALMDKHIQDDITIPPYQHVEFGFDHLEHALDLALLYEEAHGNNQIREYCSQMVTRLKAVRERDDFKFLRVKPADLRLEEKDRHLFVESILGLRREGAALRKREQIIVIDFNDAPDEVVQVSSAVLSRMIFERLRKAEPRNRIPVNLVLEEAHRYIAEKKSAFAIDASLIFERIAKEGRKYGMFLTVASQRPSELSRTVLSQCSNFVVHRIQNPDDLQHIRQMTPFISDSVMRRLPSLPKQHALIFGNAVNLPTTFKVRDVNPKPKSDDAEIRKLWFIRADADITVVF